MFKKLWRKIAPNPLDQMLGRAKANGAKSVLIPWNRGLGDIALGLYAIVYRIKEYIPDAEITFFTRKDLEDGFKMLKGIKIVVDPLMRRGSPYTIPSHLQADLVIDKADPSYWVIWQRGRLVPKMEWDPTYDDLCLRFNLPQKCIGAHVQCETNYYHERNWPECHWKELFATLSDPVVLFGLKKDPKFDNPNVIDLRGEMNLYEMLSIIKNRCRVLIAPDSGVLGLTYYLNTPFPLKLISLWADPNHGILKQNVASPNPLLEHIPLISSNKKNAALITVEEVRALC